MESKYSDEEIKKLIFALKSLQQDLRVYIQKSVKYRNWGTTLFFIFVILLNSLNSGSGFENEILNFILLILWIFGWLCIPLFMYCFSLSWKYSRLYREKYKFEIISKIIQFFIPGSQYDHTKGFNNSILTKKGSGIFDYGFKEFRSEDLIKGKYLDWFLETAEVYASMSLGKNQTITVFKGIVIKLTLPVFFSYDLIIQSKDIIQKARYKNEIRLESAEWEQTFLTYCEDNVFVRYILNPAVMVRILELNKKYPGLGISFKGNNIYILWNNGKNMFEPRIEMQNDLQLEYKITEAVADWQSILDLISELELGKEIWTQKQFLAHVTA